VTIPTAIPFISFYTSTFSNTAYTFSAYSISSSPYCISIIPAFLATTISISSSTRSAYLPVVRDGSHAFCGTTLRLACLGRFSRITACLSGLSGAVACKRAEKWRLRP